MSGVFHDAPLKERRWKFYGICVWARLALAVGMYVLQTRHPRVAGGIAIAAGVSVVAYVSGMLARQTPSSRVWWSRGAHVAFAAALAASGIALVATDRLPRALGPATVIFADLLFGLTTSFAWMR